MKDFDGWNKLKKKIEVRESLPYCKEREVWWCSIGINIGSEQDGKNIYFERPVLVLRKFGSTTIRIAPLTSKFSSDEFGMIIFYSGKKSFVLVSQIESVSLKRISRKVGIIDQEQFNNVIKKIIQSLLKQ